MRLLDLLAEIRVVNGDVVGVLVDLLLCIVLQDDFWLGGFVPNVY